MKGEKKKRKRRKREEKKERENIRSLSFRRETEVLFL